MPAEIPAPPDKKNLKNLFRKKAIDTHRALDRIDEPLRIVPPIGWLSLATIGAMLSFLIIWGIFGRIPQTVEGDGILLHGGAIEGVVSPGEGQLLDVLVKIGDAVTKNQKVATIIQTTLESEIQNQRLTVADYKTQFDTIVSTSNKQRLSQIEFNNRQKISVQTSITDYKKQESALMKVVDAQSSLLAQGLIPMTTLLQSQTQLDSTRLNILKAESQLQQIETNLIQADADARRSVDTARISLQQAEAKLQDMESRLQRNSSVSSQRVGKVVSIDAFVGQSLTSGTQILALERFEEPMKALLFFPSGKGKELLPGMSIQLSPETVRIDRYGYVLGRVHEVGQIPATEESMMAAIANKSLVEALSKGSTVIQAIGIVDLDPSTPSGLKWSSSLGPPFEISSGTLCKARTVVRQVRPIELVIPLLKDFFGVSN